ncbi:hypothetical protein AMS68_001217 [Peltaster fructicola]|uniref:Uncharacterized protein n=1 Tax=Peltaster fructicola TaxID=286661 RepID=A0A6H0XMI0_9PEZI|nr:hypothetical protein AMS68_001217 [Peltaster fructicola]
MQLRGRRALRQWVPNTLQTPAAASRWVSHKVPYESSVRQGHREPVQSIFVSEILIRCTTAGIWQCAVLHTDQISTRNSTNTIAMSTFI